MAENGSGYVREVAHRVFAAELKESNLQSKEGQDEQYPKQYLITPTGAKCNRIFIVGTLIEKEDVGTDSEFWRGHIVDPTGTFYVTPGSTIQKQCRYSQKQCLLSSLQSSGSQRSLRRKKGMSLHR